MKHLFDEETVQDLEKMMEQEQEKEITQIATTQGQIAALVAILRSKGILTYEDVGRWERESDEMTSLISSVLKATEVAKSHQAKGENEELLKTNLDILKMFSEISRRLGASKEDISTLERTIQIGREKIEQEFGGTDRED